jgi:hypothetical protein
MDMETINSSIAAMIEILEKADPSIEKDYDLFFTLQEFLEKLFNYPEYSNHN